MTDTGPIFSAVLSDASLKRSCGHCTLCCKLLPMNLPGINKAAGTRCPHQRHSGCNIYDRRPDCCRMWSCRWLLNDDTADLRRPDRSHYVIDLMPDAVIMSDSSKPDAEPITMYVVQVWVDPRFPDAHRDPALRAYMLRRAERDGMATLIRYDESNGFVIFPPPLAADGQWHEHGSDMRIPDTRGGLAGRLIALNRAARDKQ